MYQARNTLSGLLDLIVLNHTTDQKWGHWLPHLVTQNVSHELLCRRYALKCINVPAHCGDR